MNLDAYLHSTQLMDCQGRVSHTLTVMPDGNVRIRVGERVAYVEPRHRTVHPPGVHLGAGEYSATQIIEVACLLASEVGR